MNVNTIKTNFKNLIHLKKGVEKECKEGNDDIFLKAPLRPFAYSNEVGAAIEPLIGHSAALMSYFPAMCYIGADCYDKYLRGDNDDYSKPSKTRLAKEIIFQVFASVLMPTLCIHAGQNFACSLNKFIGDKIDARAKNEVSVFLKDQALKFDLSKDKEKVFNSLSKNMFEKIKNYRDQKQSSGGILKKYLKKITGCFSEALGNHVEFKHCGKIDPKDVGYKNLTKYAKKQFDDMYYLMKMLDACDTGSVKGIMEGVKKQGKKISRFKATKLFNKIQKYAKDPSIGTGRAKKLAIADMARSDLNNKSLKGGPILLTVISGFATLFIVSPILDKFGEEVLIKKIVDPILNYIKHFKTTFKITGLFYKKDKNLENKNNVNENIINDNKASQNIPVKDDSNQISNVVNAGNDINLALT